MVKSGRGSPVSSVKGIWIDKRGGWVGGLLRILFVT